MFSKNIIADILLIIRVANYKFILYYFFLMGKGISISICSS